jgi:methionine sulfoxide reductase heme-binding subunit
MLPPHVQADQRQHGQDWPLIACLSAILLVATATVALNGPDPVEATREAIRLTARTSLLCFLAAFVAASLHRLAAGRATAWLLRNRRAFGLAFVVSHLLHALVLVRLWRLDPALFDTLTTPASFIAGGSCYVVILALGLTSLHPIHRRMRPAHWARLHLWGVWIVWAFFLVNFGRRAVVNQMYWPAMALLGLALVLRLGGRAKSRPAPIVASGR